MFKEVISNSLFDSIRNTKRKTKIVYIMFMGMLYIDVYVICNTSK